MPVFQKSSQMVDILQRYLMIFLFSQLIIFEHLKLIIVFIFFNQNKLKYTIIAIITIIITYHLNYHYILSISADEFDSQSKDKTDECMT